MPTIAIYNGTARTSKYVTEYALSKGYRVKAIVRSTRRFYNQTKKHDDLSVHEWSDFSDIALLASILQGVDTLYMALGPNGNPPTHLVEEGIQSAVAALRLNLDQSSSSGKFATAKLILLSSGAVDPSVEHSPFAVYTANALLGNQYGDLQRADLYLNKQKSWLRWTILCPGAIVDVEDPVAFNKGAVRLALGEPAGGVISYRRLGAAMFEAAEDSGEKFVHGYVTPVPTSKVKTSLRDFESARAVLAEFFTSKVFPFVFRGTIFGLLFAGLGYYARMKEQGAWIAANLGLDLR